MRSLDLQSRFGRSQKEEIPKPRPPGRKKALIRGPNLDGFSKMVLVETNFGASKTLKHDLPVHGKVSPKPLFRENLTGSLTYLSTLVHDCLTLQKRGRELPYAPHLSPHLDFPDFQLCQPLIDFFSTLFGHGAERLRDPFFDFSEFRTQRARMSSVRGQGDCTFRPFWFSNLGVGIKGPCHWRKTLTTRGAV